MVYVDTSVLVAFFTNEATAARITTWFAHESRPLVSGDWCVTEFASALALKQRTQQISTKQGNAAWKVFNQFFDQNLRLLPLDRDIFNQAAYLIRDSKNGLLGLRSGDALHLALALRVGAAAFFTLDVRLAKCAKHSKLLAVDF